MPRNSPRKSLGPSGAAIVVALIVGLVILGAAILLKKPRGGDPPSFSEWCDKMVTAHRDLPSLRSDQLAAEGAGKVREYESVATCLQTQRQVYLNSVKNPR